MTAVRAVRAWPVGLLTALLCASVGGFIRPAPADVGPRAFVSNEFGGDDGTKLYTANGRSDDVTFIDTASLRVLRTIPGVGRGPHTIVIGR